MSDNSRFLSQSVNYLGFLEARLRDVQGVATLVYELAQNADDVKDEDGQPGARWISFDVRDEALVVENDGRFRPVDFERLQEIAGGSKRAEAETTGAFGLGFIAVYQVTDSPEILSSGKQWIIRPDAPAEERILEREAQTEGTTFRLPWAFAATAVRRALRLETIEPARLPELAAEIAAALPLAALFLKQLRVLEVKRNGAPVRRIEREAVGGEQLRLWQGTSEMTWHLFSGDFAETAAALRDEHRWQIEEKRRSQVWLAVPEQPIQDGRLFATLPSQTITPLPFHLNADFFPSSDRKRIVLEADYQSAWNRAAVRCAAETLAAHFERLPALLGPAGLWGFLQQVETGHRQAAEGALDGVFAAFWEGVAPLLGQRPIVFTSAGKWVRPGEARLISSEAEMAAGPLLEGLGMAIVHADLRPYAALLRRPEIGVPLLQVADVTTALNGRMAANTPLGQAPPPFQSLEAWQTVWRALEVLLRRAPTPAARDEDRRALQQCPLTLTNKGTLAPATAVARGKAETRRLFPDRLWLDEALDGETMPGSLVAEFDARGAIEYLTSYSQEELEAAWQRGQLDTTALLHWFEARQWEFVEDVRLKQQFRRLPIFPVFDRLYPLALLYIPGGFEDPLKLSGLVDVAALGGRSDFLQDLGVGQLTFETYLAEEVPRILEQHPDLRSDARSQLVALLARRLGEFRDDELVREKLRPLPLVACLDGHYRPAEEVYADRRVTAVLGDRVQVAEPASGAVQALYEWLGVAKEPKPADVIRSLSQVGEGRGRAPLDDETYRRVQNGWLHLSQALTSGQVAAAELARLGEKVGAPDRRRRWQQMDGLFFADDAQLAAKFPAALQERLLAADEAARPALAAAGVRPLSQAAQMEPAEPVESEPDVWLAARLQ
ncbi:MAG: hypothetical protein L0322_02805, partial [Chloroflexi bacterium]|nr:hypothetical protein [Chloroflexota bacterium]